jgi:hypothetical protein
VIVGTFFEFASAEKCKEFCGPLKRFSKEVVVSFVERDLVEFQASESCLMRKDSILPSRIFSNSSSSSNSNSVSSSIFDREPTSLVAPDARSLMGPNEEDFSPEESSPTVDGETQIISAKKLKKLKTRSRNNAGSTSESSKLTLPESIEEWISSNPDGKNVERITTGDKYPFHKVDFLGLKGCKSAHPYVVEVALTQTLFVIRASGSIKKLLETTVNGLDLPDIALPESIFAAPFRAGAKKWINETVCDLKLLLGSSEHSSLYNSTGTAVNSNFLSDSTWDGLEVGLVHFTQMIVDSNYWKRLEESGVEKQGIFPYASADALIGTFFYNALSTWVGLHFGFGSAFPVLQKAKALIEKIGKGSSFSSHQVFDAFHESHAPICFMLAALFDLAYPKLPKVKGGSRTTIHCNSFFGLARRLHKVVAMEWKKEAALKEEYEREKYKLYNARDALSLVLDDGSTLSPDL